jgi:hypothetical protein
MFFSFFFILWYLYFHFFRIMTLVGFRVILLSNQTIFEIEVTCLVCSGPSRAPAKCSLCAKVLSCKSALKKHMVIHAANKPFKCDSCDQSFNQHRDLKAHRMQAGVGAIFSPHFNSVA